MNITSAASLDGMCLWPFCKPSYSPMLCYLERNLYVILDDDVGSVNHCESLGAASCCFFLSWVIDSQPNPLHQTYFLCCSSPTPNRMARLNRKVANTAYIDVMKLVKHMLVTTSTDDVHCFTCTVLLGYKVVNPWFLRYTGFPLGWLLYCPRV